MPQERRLRPYNPDINPNQVLALQRRFRSLEIAEYCIEQLEKLHRSRTKKALVKFLSTNAHSLAEKETDETKKANVTAYYLIGALFVNEVTDSIPSLKVRITEITTETFTSLASNEYSSFQAEQLAPYLMEVATDVVAQAPGDLQTAFRTGMTDVLLLKIAASNLRQQRT